LFFNFGHHRLASGQELVIASTKTVATGQCAVAASMRARYVRQMTDITHLEEQIAHLTRTVDDLSDIVTRQQSDLTIATRRLEMLMTREAGREMDAGGSVPLADQRPPHW
jgi:SlyX protein